LAKKKIVQRGKMRKRTKKRTASYGERMEGTKSVD